MSQTAVIQAKRGIGDVIWHLPFVRAIAAADPAGAVSFLAPPSSHAKELLQAEPSVAEVLYFAHEGSEIARGLHLVRLATLLRRRRFGKVWILDRTLRPAMAALLAGVPERIGPGLGPQRYLITNPGIDMRHRSAWATDWLRELLAAMRVPLTNLEPDLKLPPATLAKMRARLAATPRPFVAIALSGSHPTKDWSDAYWAEFLGLLRRETSGSVLIVGGPDNTARADQLIARSAGAPALNFCDLSLLDAAALLQLSDLFVGPDSGPMNLAAAGGTPAFAMFGATPVHAASRFIYAIEPADGRGQALDGMTRILPAQVMARIAPYLGVTKAT